ncbi:hypothetical protein [Dysgonomonas sp. 511]|uniref:hypothetical protein n=1 Tax=Dysgonomonas sp. 511 TaxID=2302930 RepID=UPI0013D5EF0A|nr:hypothetical protein [Dysgonomonas sp. 511]NDV77630.1 hypothetical protein [Dysgonomonas sp. 511]
MTNKITKFIKTHKVNLLIFTIPAITIIYYAAKLLTNFDESYTYFHFVDKPVYYCMFHYPFPNNHILHSLLMHLANLLPIPDPLIRLRVFVIIGSICTWLITYYFTNKYYGQKVAMFISGLFPMMAFSISFGFFSRGYYLILLFFIICLFAAYDIVKNNNSRRGWIMFSISSILGFYTMPSFLYPFLTVNAIIFVFNYKNIKKQILYNAITGTSVFLLYLPIIIFDGIEVLIGNDIVRPIGRFTVLKRLPEFLYSLISVASGIKGWIILIALIVSLALLIKKRDRSNLIIFAILAAAPFGLLILHGVIPFERTFAYYSFIIIFLIGISFSDYINKVPKTALMAGIVALQIFLFINYGKHEYYRAHTFGKEFTAIRHTIIEEHKSCYISTWWAEEFFRFEALREGSDQSKITYGNQFELVSADTLDYDYIFIDVVKDMTESRKAAYSDGLANLYVKEKE